MESKLCPKCNSVKIITEFYQRKRYRTGEYYEKCKDCMKDRGRKYYHLNRKRQCYLAILRKHKYIEERREWIATLKNKPCADCGKIYPPWVMDFDHHDGRAKVASISNMITHNPANYERIKRELIKCDLVCANCHKQRTHIRLVTLKSAGNETPQ